MSNKLVLIRITQSNFNFEEGQEFYAFPDDDGFTVSYLGEDIFVSDGEAELVGEEHE